MSWRERYTAPVTEITRDTFSGKEEMTTEEEAFLLCALKASGSAGNKLFAVRVVDQVIVVPGNAPEDLWLYAIDERGGIRRVNPEAVESMKDRLIPVMPFSTSTACLKCGELFAGGDVVFSMVKLENGKDKDGEDIEFAEMKPGSVRDYCWKHIRFALKYNRREGSGTVAYSFHAADEIDKHDPVVILNTMLNVPKALDIMVRLLRDIVGEARRLKRQGRLGKKWAEDFRLMVDAQSATLRVLKFTGGRAMGLLKDILEVAVAAQD